MKVSIKDRENGVYGNISQVREISRFGDLVSVVENETWSPFEFKLGGKSSGANFVGFTNLLVYDIDDGVPSIEEIRNKINGYQALIGTTKSHQVWKQDVNHRTKNPKTEEQKKKWQPKDRYRIVFELDKSPTTKEEYLFIWKEIANKFDLSVDEDCKNLERVYLPCKEVVYINTQGKALEISGFQFHSRSKLESFSQQKQRSRANSRTPESLVTQLTESLETDFSEFITNETNEKYILKCILNNHNDTHPSAVFFKDSGNYHCSSCGVNLNAKELFKELELEEIADKWKEFLLNSIIYIDMYNPNSGDCVVLNKNSFEFKTLPLKPIQQYLGEDSENLEIQYSYFVYNPNKPSFFEEKVSGMPCFNTYSPPRWKQNFFYREQPIKEAILPDIYRKFFQHLNTNNNSYEYFLDWLSNSLKTRNYTFLLAIGKEGGGKGILGEILKCLHGERNYRETTTRIIKGQFNSQILNKTLVFVDEIRIRDIEEINRVKVLVNNTVEVELKGKDAITAQNFASYYFCSNDMDSVNIPAGDRRWSVLNFTDKKLIDTDLYLEYGNMSSYIKELCSDENIKQLAKYLWNKKIKNNMLIPFKEARFAEILDYNLSGWERWIIEEASQIYAGQKVDFKEFQQTLIDKGDFQLKKAPGRPKFDMLASKFPEIFSIGRNKNNHWYLRFANLEKKAGVLEF